MGTAVHGRVAAKVCALRLVQSVEFDDVEGYVSRLRVTKVTWFSREGIKSENIDLASHVPCTRYCCFVHRMREAMACNSRGMMRLVGSSNIAPMLTHTLVFLCRVDGNL